MLNNVVIRLQFYIRRVLAALWPFTPMNIICRHLDRTAQSILDIGCGKGMPMRRINSRGQFFTVGADIFAPYLRECKRANIHDDYILCDVQSLPVRKKSFDIVLCIEVLEHLEEKDGEKLIEAMEEITRRQVIITTPVNYEQHAYDGNPWQQHRASWSPARLQELGYKVRGVGLRGMSGERGIISHLPDWLKPLTSYLWNLPSPLSYFLLGLAEDLVCIKQVSPD